ARAAQTKAAADRVVAEAQEAVAASQATLTATVGEVADARRRDALLAKAEAIAQQRASVPFEAITGALTPRPGATCTGQVLRGYPNGMLPEVALCPLWGTSWHMLRADAAAAFDEMSRAYALEFGAPICVTDSYRSFPEQVAVRKAKPTLAAVPGTSNHGWAVALDLCDGVQTFGSPQHEWMRANSLRFGWFHPAWAQQGGSKPEAWHWEFAG
ncbi:MAG: M15 family metallopeptidase, partial [Actinomycetota bacterium]|nr:M15 family metallopeptidase [Actinomycetota bacterium]